MLVDKSRVALLVLWVQNTLCAPRLEDLRTTAEQMPESAAALSNYGTGLKAAGRLEEAFHFFDEALHIDPHFARAYNNMGNAYQAVGDFETAVAAHGQAILLMPGLASAYSNLGNALRELGEPARAVEALTSAVTLNPVYPAGYTNLGSALLAVGQPQAAAQHQALAAALTGFRDPSVLSNLGAALEASSRYEEAGMAFDAALEVQPSSAVLLVNKGNIHRRRGQLTEAVHAYSAAIAIEPDGADTATAYNNVAAALQAEGNLERAMQAYEHALELQPGHRSATENRDKLPLSDRYRAAAAYEAQVLSSRAGRSLLAAAAAKRKVGARGRGKGASPQLAPALHRVTRYLRRLETKQLSGAIADRLWHGRAADMPSAIRAGLDGSGGYDDDDGSRVVTVSAFAWGGVWYQTLAPAFLHPHCRAALRQGGPAVILGSSIGFEAYFTSLTFGVPTVGVELLCSLSALSNDVRAAHAVSTSLTNFECADALSFSLPKGASLVYVDDTAWDTPTIAKLASKLSRELPRGSCVVHNTQHGYDDEEGSRSYTRLGAYAVGTSWNPEHIVYAHKVA